MPANPVVFLDTTVLLNLLRVPGRSADADSVLKEFAQLLDQGAKFVIPITAIIETGNAIANSTSGDRRAAADRLSKAIEAAKASDPPWTIRDVSWDENFLGALIAGASTGSRLVDHLGAGRLGTGDVAILVERDRFREESAFQDVRIWSLDNGLRSYS